MSKINALASLSKAELVQVLTTLLSEDVAQVPAQEPKEAKAQCAAIAASTGERCTRNATQGEVCKSHVEWDNDEALAKHAKAQEFVESRRKAAKAKGKGPKVDNKVLAAHMRDHGLTPNGEAWAQVKALIADEVPMEVAVRTVAAQRKA